MNTKYIRNRGGSKSINKLVIPKFIRAYINTRTDITELDTETGDVEEQINIKKLDTDTEITKFSDMFIKPITAKIKAKFNEHDLKISKIDTEIKELEELETGDVEEQINIKKIKKINIISAFINSNIPEIDIFKSQFKDYINFNKVESIINKNENLKSIRDKIIKNDGCKEKDIYVMKEKTLYLDIIIISVFELTFEKLKNDTYNIKREKIISDLVYNNTFNDDLIELFLYYYNMIVYEILEGCHNNLEESEILNPFIFLI
jgi:hypothetical protein